MKAADLKILIQEGEGTTLEFKENLSASLAREMVAMANTIGGKILLGVRDDGFVTTIFRPNPEVRAEAEAQAARGTEQVTAHVPHMYRTSPQQVALLEAAAEPRSREELQAVAGIRHRQHFLLEYLRPLLDAGLLEPTIPDKPRSSKQRYRLTEAGREYLKRNKETE